LPVELMSGDHADVWKAELMSRWCGNTAALGGLVLEILSNDRASRADIAKLGNGSVKSHILVFDSCIGRVAW
jgi:hypothetical protein